MRKVSAELEKRIDKYINEECGGWAPRRVVDRYGKWRNDILDGKIILDRIGKEDFKNIERRRRNKLKTK